MDRSTIECEASFSSFGGDNTFSVTPRTEVMPATSYKEEAEAAIVEFGAQADSLVPTGILGPLAHWLRYPNWLRDGTSMVGEGLLPDSVTLRDDMVMLANILDRGHGPSLLARISSSDRLITGPNVALIVRNAPTLHDALNQMATALSATNPAIGVKFRVDGPEAHVEVVGRIAAGRLLDFISAVRIILALRVIERFLLRRADEAYVELTLSRDFAELEFVNGTAGRIDFPGVANRLSFPAALIGRRNSDHDPTLWSIAQRRVRAMERRAADRDIANQLRHRVSEMLASAHRVPRLKELAIDLEMSDRTLGRKLSDLGIRFQDIVNDEQKSVVEQCLLDSSLSLTNVARLSGFRHLSSFSRTFRSWFGISPTQYRHRASRIDH